MKHYKTDDIIFVEWFDSWGETQWAKVEEIKADVGKTKPLRSVAQFVEDCNSYIVLAVTYDPNNNSWSGRQTIYKRCIISDKLILRMGNGS